MICPFCLHKKTKVYNSRSTKKLNETWRRRQCLDCNKQFSTRETVDLSTILKINKTGKVKDFSLIRLMSDISRAIDHLEDVDQKTYWLTQLVQQRLLVISSKTQGVVDIKEFTEICAAILKKYDYPAFIKYSTANGLKVRR